MDEKDYSKGKIYMIWSPHTDKIYIGSTLDRLKERFRKHKYASITSKIILDCGDAEIKLIRNFPCGSLFELETEEGRVMRLHPNRVNINMPRRTKQELKELADIKNEKRRNTPQEQRDKQNEKRRNWSKEHKDKINERRRYLNAEKKKAKQSI
jgi:hypothetical protein